MVTSTVLDAAFVALQPIAFKADLFRYCALWNEGGWYMDDDLMLMDTFENVLNPAAPTGKATVDLPF